MESPLLALENYPGVTIGAINGCVRASDAQGRLARRLTCDACLALRFAFTGGFELALGCDILIAAETAQFADTHCKFGIHPSWGLSQKLPRIIGPGRARVMSFTAKPIDAATAERWGLVTAVTKPELLMQKAFKVPRLCVWRWLCSGARWRLTAREGRRRRSDAHGAGCVDVAFTRPRSLPMQSRATTRAWCSSTRSCPVTGGRCRLAKHARWKSGAAQSALAV